MASAVSLKRLLKKKSWTGEEIGKLQLLDLAITYKTVSEGKEAPPPLISEEQIIAAKKSLREAGQAEAYNNILSIYLWLQTRPAASNGYYFLLDSAIKEIGGHLNKAAFAEDIYRYAEKLPIIMTKAQYDRHRAERIEASFTDEDGQEITHDVYDLIMSALIFYADQLQREPRKANPLKAIKKRYSAQPVKSEIIRSLWGSATGEGYYTIEDGSGRRSDTMSAEEWEAATTPPATPEDLPGQTMVDGVLLDARARMDGATEEEYERTVGAWAVDHGIVVPTAWHEYEEAPEGLTKWAALEQLPYSDLYPADLDGSGDAWSEDNFTRSMKDFAAEFPELVTVILEDMDKRYFKGKPGLAALPVEKWATAQLTSRQLYEMDFYGERAYRERDSFIFDGNTRAQRNGVAILRESEIFNYSLDSRGHYVEPDLAGLVASHALEEFFPESENYAKSIGELEGARDNIITGYCAIMGFNAQIDIIIELTGVQELEVFKENTARIAERIEAMNNLIPLVYGMVQRSDYADKELQARKLEVLRDVFQPVDWKSLAIPPENLRKARELAKDFSAFSSRRHDFDVLLCYWMEE